MVHPEAPHRKEHDMPAQTRRAHQHRVAREDAERCYQFAVADPENEAAHGGVSCVQRCRCGASRIQNRNGQHIETGKWVQMPEGISR